MIDAPAGRSELSFASGPAALQKWTVLPATEVALERLHCVALACATQHDAAAFRHLFRLDFIGKERSATIQCVLVRHAPQECGPCQPARQLSGWVIPAQGPITPLTEARRWAGLAPFRAPPRGESYASWFLLGYGARVQADPGTDCLKLALDFRRKRFASLLDRQATVTNPVAFLERLHYRGMVNGRPRSQGALARLNRELAPWFRVAPDAWLKLRHDFQHDWDDVPKAHRPLIIVALDAARHILEFAGKTYQPWNQPGIMVMDCPDRWCSREHLPEFLQLLDRLFPQLQFILRLGVAGCGIFPGGLRTQSLSIPRPEPRPAKRKPTVLPRDGVLLVDVDASMPNLALMKLSRFFKNQGRRVALARVHPGLPEADSVLASCIFKTPASLRHVHSLRQRFNGRLEVGGSGVSLKTRLPRNIEDLDADYSLYPELGDRAIGFLTRGCPRHCPFCVVPLKEGKPKLVGDLKSLLQGRRKLILLDDNLLAHPQADDLLAQMAGLNLAVNFNQTLDLRLLTPAQADLLRRIQCSNASFTRRCYHFSLNDTRGMETLEKRLRLLQLSRQDNVEFICMYGFRTTLAEDIERFRFLRSLPRTYVFVQRYQPAPGGPEPQLEHFFDEHAEAQLDALVRIVFPQNMKSMEVYYRWLCLLYARQCGRIHDGLMDALFRYNRRHTRGAFTAKLQAICDGRGQPEPG